MTPAPPVKLVPLLLRARWQEGTILAHLVLHSYLDLSTRGQLAVVQSPLRNWGVPVCCLLDSGSQVSTITESFFNQQFCPRGSDLMDTKKWLPLTAANGLKILYIGYLELERKA